MNPTAPSCPNVGDLELINAWSDDDPARGARFAFPIHSGTGAAASSVVYFEVEPGRHLGMHTDSAEEILYVTRGAAHAIVGGDRLSLRAGDLALIPAMVPHDVVCEGDEPVRVVGFWSSATVVSVFEQPFAPIGRRILGTPIPEDVPNPGGVS